MSHRDAPPETASQIACREWWQKAQPHVTRAWGRAKDGAFLAEGSRLLHEAWVAASALDAQDAARYRWLCDGNGYFMEENFLCGHGGGEKASADHAIDWERRNAIDSPDSKPYADRNEPGHSDDPT